MKESLKFLLFGLLALIMNVGAVAAPIVEPETEPIATISEAVPLTGVAVSSAAILALEVQAQNANAKIIADANAIIYSEKGAFGKFFYWTCELQGWFTYTSIFVSGNTSYWTQTDIFGNTKKWTSDYQTAFNACFPNQ